MSLFPRPNEITCHLGASHWVVGSFVPKIAVKTLSWTFGLVSPAHWPGKALSVDPGSEAEYAHSFVLSHSFSSQSISGAWTCGHDAHTGLEEKVRTIVPSTLNGHGHSTC